MTTADPTLPVAVVGAGPVGLVTALGLLHHGVPTIVLEEDERLSMDTKAGTVLTRTLEVLARYDAADPVLRASLRIDEIGDLDLATNSVRASVRTAELFDDTRFPFVINIPQHELEPVLRAELERRAPEALRMRHRLTAMRQDADGVDLDVDTPEGLVTIRASHVLACDGGRSTVRQQLGIAVSGMTLPERYALIDLHVDLDIEHPRDYPYLAYFGDPQEWMILIRQPHCWRFLFPLPPDRGELTQAELVEKARRFIGDVGTVDVVGSNVYAVHHRVADRWREGRVFLMGDAAHLITPMWALGLNTGVLDASNLPWRLAWVRRGWATDELLAGYEHEQKPVAVNGSAEMAETARQYMQRVDGVTGKVTDGGWGNAFTRALLGVRLDVDGTGNWSMIKRGDSPSAVALGDRAPDLPLFGPDGVVHVHELVDDAFVALYFTDARRRPAIPRSSPPGLVRRIVSRWDAPHDSGLRDLALFDPGERVRSRFGVPEHTMVLLRPDGHVAAIEAFDPSSDEDRAAALYAGVTGDPARATAADLAGPVA